MLIFNKKTIKLSPSPVNQQFNQKVNKSLDEMSGSQLISRHRYSQRRQIKTSQSSRAQKKMSAYKSIDPKTPRITNQLSINYESKIWKLGLQDYLKNAITERNPQKVQQDKKKKELILKVLNSTWIRQNIYPIDKGAFRASFRQKTFSKTSQPKVQWPTQSQKVDQNWKEATHISHHLFPCRRPTQRLKDRFYKNCKNNQEVSQQKNLYEQMNTENVIHNIQKKLNTSLNLSSTTKLKKNKPLKFYKSNQKRKNKLEISDNGSILGIKAKLYQ